MSLFVIATPIGHIDDITIRAKKQLASADIVIGEEYKETSKLLKRLNIENKPIDILNEHNRDLKDHLHLCQTKTVALISDGGTPGFCDPGADLVALCRKNNIPVYGLPGASSLTTFLSVMGVTLNQFYFRGFLPAKKELRQREWKNLRNIKCPIILMDTPYRLQKFLDETHRYYPKKQLILGYNLTQDTEELFSGTPSMARRHFKDKKGEFIALIL